MGAKKNTPGTLRYRMEQARQIKSRPRRERALAALEAEREALILSVHDWVWKRVNVFYRRFHVRPHDRDDLAQAAFLRVTMGADVYDPAQSKPTTYFGYVAWDGMQKWYDARHLIHVPRTSAKAGNADLRQQAERVSNASMLSLDYEYPDDGQPSSWAIEEEERPYEFDDLERLREALRYLPARDRSILLDRMAGRTMEAIGLDHGISKERVRQIQILATENLRRRLSPEGQRKSEAARKGAQAIHAAGKAHRFTSEAAQVAGRRGGRPRKARVA